MENWGKVTGKQLQRTSAAPKKNLPRAPAKLSVTLAQSLIWLKTVYSVSLPELSDMTQRIIDTYIISVYNQEHYGPNDFPDIYSCLEQINSNLT
jgi:hypothetical protein